MKPYFAKIDWLIYDWLDTTRVNTLIAIYCAVQVYFLLYYRLTLSLKQKYRFEYQQLRIKIFSCLIRDVS